MFEINGAVSLPLVSVIILTYKRSNMLLGTIDSVLTQTYKTSG